MGRIILVVGYYYRNNLGDDLFIDTIPNFFQKSKLEFVSADDVINTNLGKYSGIIFGGGDLVNDYFDETVKDVRSRYNGPIFAFSIGIPYVNTITSNYMNHYDHVFTRNKKYLIPLQYALGSQNAHYLPDAVMSFKDIPAVWSPTNNNTIGVFFPVTINTPRIIFKICFIFRDMLEKDPSLKLHFACFDTKDDHKNDRHINKVICDSLSDYRDRLINDTTRYNGSEMMTLIAGCRMCICSRFHSNILSILTETPMLSFHYANKVGILMEEKGLMDLFCPIDITPDIRPKDFNIEIFLQKFEYINNNLEKINANLKDVKTRDRYLCTDNFQVEALLHLGTRRNITPCSYFTDRVDAITKKFTKKITDITKLSLDKSIGVLTRVQSENISRSMLYEITGEISCRGVDGTINNLIHKPQELRGMVDWCWKDKRNRMGEVPRFNMLTTCNQSFCGIHRAGWKFVLDTIHSLHSEYGVILDVYCDATFGWCREYPCREYGLIPYTSPWCGFFHHTPASGGSDNNITHSTNNPEFIKSLETCLGLFVMSDWLAEWLVSRLKFLGYGNVPVVSLVHPTLTIGIIPFIIPTQHEQINIVNIGAWLRNTWSIYAIDLDPKIFSKFKLKGKMMNNYFPPDDLKLTLEDIRTERHSNAFMYCLCKYIRDHHYLYKELGYESEESITEDQQSYIEKLEKKILSHIDTVTTLDHLSNNEYDLLMSKYVVFVDFIECSAANTLIECMARGNPIIVNRIPAVVQHLGDDYPLFFDNIEDVSSIVTYENIKKAEEYMKRSEIMIKVSSDKFYNDLVSSVISDAVKLNNHITS